VHTLPRHKSQEPGIYFIADEQSQLLALADALLSGEIRMITAAFEAVVRTRGIDSLAAAGGLDRLRLREAISKLSPVDQALLTKMVMRLLRENQAASASEDSPLRGP
jgi:DNA-binding phage protein